MSSWSLDLIILWSSHLVPRLQTILWKTLVAYLLRVWRGGGCSQIQKISEKFQCEREALNIPMNNFDFAFRYGYEWGRNEANFWHASLSFLLGKNVHFMGLFGKFGKIHTWNNRLTFIRGRINDDSHEIKGPFVLNDNDGSFFMPYEMGYMDINVIVHTSWQRQNYALVLSMEYISNDI